MKRLYKVFNFRSLKIVLAKSAEGYFGYSVDSKYPEFSRAVIRGSAKDIVEVCIYLYRSRLLTAYNCEMYEVPSYEFDVNSDVDVRDWVSYVLNRYLFGTFRMYYEYTYKNIPYTDDTPSLYDYIEDGIAINYW